MHQSPHLPVVSGSSISRRWRLIAVVAVLGSSVANAQQQPTELRGNIEDGREFLLEDGIVDRRSFGTERDDAGDDEGFRPPEYRPFSEDALADDAADPEAPESIFDLNRDTSSAGQTVVPLRRVRRDPEEEELGRAESRGAKSRGAKKSAEAEADVMLDDEMLTGTASTQPVDAFDPARNEAAERQNRRESPPGQALTSDEEEDPYAPLGIRVGTFTVFPSLEQGIAWTSNADYSTTGSEALLSETTLRLTAVSDWSRHAAELEAYGTFRKSVSGQEVSDPAAGVSGRLRLDLADGFTGSAGIEYELKRETAESAVVIPGVETQPLLQTLSGELGVARDSGKLRLAATASVERQMFGDAELSGGGTLSQRERNSTTGAFTLRTGYEVSPALVPFVEGEIGRRQFDQHLDSAGYARSANRFGLRAGVELDLGEKLTGELAAGWITEIPEDDRLAAIEGVSVDAALAWSPMRGTVVTLDANTTVETTTDPGASGSILYAARAGLKRDVRADLTTNAAAGLSFRDYTGISGEDLILDIEAGFTWWLNRYFGLTGRAGYQNVSSTLPDRDAETTTVFMGITLRR